jgi:hypothetical protein
MRGLILHTIISLHGHALHRLHGLLIALHRLITIHGLIVCHSPLVILLMLGPQLLSDHLLS